MIKPEYTHALVAAVIAIILGAISPLTGFTAAFAFYYGRELAQVQSKIAKSEGVARSEIWYKGLSPLKWDKDQQKELAYPAISAAIISIVWSVV